MNTVIEIRLKSQQDYESRFREDKLSKDLNEYILSECDGVEAKSDYELRVYPEFDMNKQEQDRFVDMVHDHFNSEVQEIKYGSKKSFWVDAVCLTLGILVVIAYLILKKTSEISSELILVLGWVLLWEGVDNLVFANIRTRIDVKRKRKLAQCEVAFKS